MRHRHTTPFEMCEIKFHVKLPIFVARQWIRHRTANVNEYSARYSIMDKEFYIPSPGDTSPRSPRSTGRAAARCWMARKRPRCWICCGRTPSDATPLRRNAERGRRGRPGRRGLARELARMNLTLNTYTQWYWKTDLHNLFHFLSLRAESHAQYEIRVYAEAMLRMTEAWVPLACAAFRDYRLGAVTLSAQMVEVVKRMLAGEAVTAETSGLNRREWAEFAAHFQPG